MSRRLPDREGVPGPPGGDEYPRSTVVDDGSSVLAPPLDDPEPPPDRPTGALPPVVAVIVTHDPGPWFEETLESLRAQTYSALSVLIIDAASEENPTARIASVLPTAYVRRIDRNDGFASAANEVLGSVEGAAFYLICHDDVALDPDTIRTLVEEAFRSNAGVVGPKLVAWDVPGELRQVGASVDKAGVLAPYAEPGELDQEQHDAVRDVFVVPGGCTLVRADLFAALGGYDAGIDYLGEDLDLCWRAHVAGARVLVVPSAQVRHLEALGLRRDVDDRRRLQARHRLRTVLACYRPFHLVRVLPQAAVMTVVEGGYALAAGQPRQAADVVGAWTWNLRRIGEIRAKRKSIKPTRSVPDKEVRELQVRGSARPHRLHPRPDRQGGRPPRGHDPVGPPVRRRAEGPVEPGRARRRRRGPGPRGHRQPQPRAHLDPRRGRAQPVPVGRRHARRVDLDVAHVRAGRGGARASGARRDRRGELAARGRLRPRAPGARGVPPPHRHPRRLAPGPADRIPTGRHRGLRRLRSRPRAVQRARPRQLGWPRRLRRRAVGRPAAGAGQPARALRARGPRRRLARGLGHPRHAVPAPPDRRPRSRPGRGCVVPAVRRGARPRHRGRPGARITRGRSARRCRTDARRRGRGHAHRRRAAPAVDVGPRGARRPAGTCSPGSARPTAATSPPRRCCASRPVPTAACSATPC